METIPQEMIFMIGFVCGGLCIGIIAVILYTIM